MISRMLHRPMRRFALGVTLLVGMTSTADAQWSTTYEQFYLQASHNWRFRNNYQAADRLFNAFDYGHAILYETLWRFPEAPASRLEETEYDRLTTQILVKPPRIPLEEAAILIRYAQLAPEAKMMFDWAHILHRQIYDVLADERMDQAAKDAEVARLIRYYKSRPDLAFSSKAKSMALMQEQPYSLAFRQKYPKFNGLIWAYHWLQMGLYEPLLVGRTVQERHAGIRATVARFWQMLGDAPRTVPYQMPMTVAIAPKFAEKYPEASIIFDNLHSMHDVVSDILANPSVPRNRKRAEILLAARRYRDDSSYVMTEAAWRTMSLHMGAENMGGVAVGFLPTLPTPSVTAGAVMQHDPVTGAMTKFLYGNATGGDHTAHGAATPGADPHAGHAAPPDTANAHPGHAAADSTKSVRHTAADVAFMQGMIGHHAQALQMAALVAARTENPSLRLLAERIDVSQRDEIAAMARWLTARGLTVPDTAAAHGAQATHHASGGDHGTMPGMLSTMQLDSLTAARGPLFDRLFLQYMIQHHEGALTMVATLLATPGAARETVTSQFATEVDVDQRSEIRRMQALLATISATRRR